MSFQNKYINWLNKNNCPINPKSCPLNCIKLKELLGEGGGSIVIRGKIKKTCNHPNIFNIPYQFDVAVKICNLPDMGPEACDVMLQEICNVLKFSYLCAYNISINFLFCLGFGYKCCIAHNLPNIIKNKFDMEEYNEYYFNEGICESFIVTNIVDGKNFDFDSELTPRQTFEYVYSLLCSCYYFNQIPGDRNLTNLMSNETNHTVSITINNNTLYFDDTKSIVHIDYGVMSDCKNLTFGLLSAGSILNKKYKDDIKNILEYGKTYDKISKLVDLFKDYNIDPKDQKLNSKTNKKLEFIKNEF